ncbi:pilin [Patescibacteria group bacterium]|nr:pilin [Patescibacteria group bacterium]
MSFLFKKNKLWQLGFVALFLFLTASFLLPCSLFAQEAPPPASAALEGLDLTAQKAQINTEITATQMVGYIINLILGFLGVIFLVLVIYGGFQWMTAGGNEEKVKKGRDMIVQAAIGLAIILFAFVLTNFVIFRLLGIAVGNGSSPY